MLPYLNKCCYTIKTKKDDQVRRMCNDNNCHFIYVMITILSSVVGNKIHIISFPRVTTDIDLIRAIEKFNCMQ